MISFRLEAELEQQLNQYSAQKNISKSQVIKEALAQYFARQSQEQSPYQIGKALFGRYASGQNDLSSTYKQKIKDKIRAKNTH